jgi:hypothetical protein
VRGFQSFFDCPPDSLRVRQYLVVPEAQNAETECFKPCRARPIGAFIQRVLPTVRFNDQFLFQTCKICHIRPNWMLPSEFRMSDLAISQNLPQSFFSIGDLTPKHSRCASFLPFSHLHGSPLILSPSHHSGRRPASRGVL